MSRREDILQQALTLTPEDRPYVVTALEDSLEQEGLPSEAFLLELGRRSAAFRAGATAARQADEVLADLRQRQNAENSQ